MTTRQDFEAWAIDADYSVHKNKLFLYTMQRTKRAWAAYQAATLRQEAKIKALVEALEELDKKWREFNVYEFGLQGEETDAFYSLPSTTAAIDAAKETP